MAESKTPGPGIDTGTGGFRATGVDDKRHTFDPGSNAGNQPSTTWSGGQVNVDKSVKDLSAGTKKTLADYLSKTTLGQTPSGIGSTPNKYPIASNSIVASSLKEQAGKYTAPLTSYDSQNTQAHFANLTPGDSRSSSASQLKIVRGNQAPPQGATKDGNDLLKTAVQPPTALSNPPQRGTVNVGSLAAGPVKEYTASVLKSPSSNALTVEQLFSVAQNTRTLSTPVPASPVARVNYLSAMTRGENPGALSPLDNSYPITPGATSTVLVEPGTGYVPPLTPMPSTSGQPHFANLIPGDSRSRSVLITRGRSKPPADGAPDGNKLLTSAVTLQTGVPNPPPKGTVNISALQSGPVKDYVGAVLGRNIDNNPSVYSTSSNLITPSTPVPNNTAARAAYLSDVTKGEKSAPSSVDNAYPVDATNSIEISLKNGQYAQNLTSYSTTDAQKRFAASLLPGDSRRRVVAVNRGRQQPLTGVSDDGNSLLPAAVTPPASAPNPPPKGTVNVGNLAAGPVKEYTDAELGRNTSNNPTVFSAVDNAINPSTPVPASDKLKANRLSEMTKGNLTFTGTTRPNKYPVENAATDDPTALRLKTDGYVSPLSTTTNSSNSTQPHFTDVTPGDSRSFDQLTSTEVTRGQEKPADAANPAPDGNVLLKTAGAPPPGAIQNPPPRGTVNMGTLATGPVKVYTARVLKTPTLGVLTVDKMFSESTSQSMGTSTPTPKSPSEAASYLSRATKGELPTSVSTVDNAYPIENGETQAPTVLSTQDAGYAAPLTVTAADQPKFSDIGTGRSNASINLNIQRGREKPPANVAKVDGAVVDGNVLLKTSVKNQTGIGQPLPGSVNLSSLNDASPVKPYTEGLLTNKYSNDKSFVSDENNTSLRPPSELENPRPSALLSQDLPEKKKKTLLDYLGKITATGPEPMKGNAYFVDTSSSEAETLLDGGYPNPPHLSPNTKQFVNGNSLSSKSDASVNLASTSYTVSRIKNPAPTTGNTLLRNATGVIDENGNFSPEVDKKKINPSAYGGELPVINKSSQVSKAISEYYGKTDDISTSVIYNRFNPDRGYEVEVKTREGKEDDPVGVKINKYNQFAKKYKLGAAGPAEGEERSFSFGRLAQVGSSLSIRAGLEPFSTSDNSNPTGGPAQAEALLPGGAQFGIMRPTQLELEAKTVFDALSNDVLDEDNLIDPMSKSWGTLNNVHDQFSGVSAWGMQLLAVALLVALTVVLTIMYGIFSLIPSATMALQGLDNKGRRPYGANRVDPSAGNYGDVTGIVEAIIQGKFNFWRMLGISASQNEFSKCLPVGALSFFGGAPSPSELSWSNFGLAAAQALLRVAQNPGYYSVMTRAVNRSFLIIGDAFVGLGKAFGQGAVAGLQALFGIIEVLRSSKFMKSVNIFVQLGDQALRLSSIEDNLAVDVDATVPLSIGGIRLNSQIDLNPMGDAAMRSRVKTPAFTGNSLTLAWASWRSPDLLIMPWSIGNVAFAGGGSAGGDFGVPPMLPTAPVELPGNRGVPGGIKYGGVYQTSATGRISTEIREKIEDALEAEYMPFYLHDVRTNEIVSFHAFLASLSDDYTASYDSFEAYGRVEPVKTYKGTSRKIGFSFYIVATNPQDFNSMWLKINKLTTMVYPQFDQGREISTTDNKYVMRAPFSQNIIASPMVRLRIGDLVRSNYSKFNLSRLFGYGDAGTSFDGVKMPSAPSEASKAATVEDLMQKSKDIESKIFVIGNTFMPLIPLASPEIPSTFPGIPIKTDGPSTDPTIGLPIGLELKIESGPDASGNYTCIVQKASDDEINKRGISGEAVTKLKEDLKQYEGEGGSDRAIIGKRFLFKKDQMTPTKLTEEKILREWGDSGIGNYRDKVVEFMSDALDANKGNAISKSFRSSGGRGLAGFIESLSFDWYDRTTWEIGYGVDSPNPQTGRRAPKMCKVTVAFSPIHDITPGLDFYGFNRAPIYPVGSFAFNDRVPPSK